jgi:predicted small secreted protein
MKRILMALICVAMLAGIFGSMGCETFKGAGRDVENAGEAMQGE